MKRSDDNRISQIKIPDAAVAIAAAAAQNSTNSGMYSFYCDRFSLRVHLHLHLPEVDPISYA